MEEAIIIEKFKIIKRQKQYEIYEILEVDYYHARFKKLKEALQYITDRI